MKYYLSRYNIFITENNESFIYNLISGSIFSLNHELFTYLKESETNSEGIIDTNIFENGFLESLRINNIIYREDNNELDSLEIAHNLDKFDRSFLSLVILPTLKCNLDCHYCYEKSKNQTLNFENEQILRRLFDQQSQSKRCINVRWSGGEILMIWNRIRELSKYIIEVCDKNNCLYASSAISNGTLITERIIEEMIDCRIRSIQITLDGSSEFHNKVRYYKNGKGSFERIIEGIKIASQKLKVLVRINIDRENIASMKTLFKSLSSSNINKSNIQLFCKPVMCTLAKLPKTKLFSHNEFYAIELELLKLAEEYNLPYAFHWGVKGLHLRCPYNCYQGYYVTPELKLYKCPAFVDIDEDRAIGYISESGNIQINNLTELNKGLSYSPFKLSECLSCKVLPICYGKCPVFWEINNHATDEGCIPEKKSMENKLRYALRNEVQLNVLRNAGIM